MSKTTNAPKPAVPSKPVCTCHSRPADIAEAEWALLTEAERRAIAADDRGGRSSAPPVDLAAIARTVLKQSILGLEYTGLAGQRGQLIARIKLHGFDRIMDEVAYTWFNRLAALRYMEIHDYLGHGWRVLSSREGGLAFTGFAFDLNSSQASAILKYLPVDARTASKYEVEKVRLYTADNDPMVLEMMARQVGAIVGSASSSALKLEYAPCAVQALVDRLRQIPAYAKASIQIQKVSVTREILVMQKWIKEYKALQIRHFMSDLAGKSHAFFGPLQVQLAGKHSSIVTPPVLERHSGALVVVEGNARLYHCFTNGIDSIDAVVVEGVTESLPGDGRFSVGDLRLISSTRSVSENYPSFKQSLYRPIERATHETYE